MMVYRRSYFLCGDDHITHLLVSDCISAYWVIFYFSVRSRFRRIHNCAYQSNKFSCFSILSILHDVVCFAVPILLCANCPVPDSRCQICMMLFQPTSSSRNHSLDVSPHTHRRLSHESQIVRSTKHQTAQMTSMSDSRSRRIQKVRVHHTITCHKDPQRKSDRDQHQLHGSVGDHTCSQGTHTHNRP